MSENRSDLAVGVSVFAGTLMVLIGILHAVQGVVALVNDTFFVVGTKWTFSFDVTTWGWAHLLIGIIVAFAGFFVFRGAVWARTVGVLLAVVSAVANFTWLPYYPVWALVVIALDVLVIWALTIHGRDVAD